MAESIQSKVYFEGASCSHHTTHVHDSGIFSTFEGLFFYFLEISLEFLNFQICSKDFFFAKGLNYNRKECRVIGSQKDPLKF